MSSKLLRFIQRAMLGVILFALVGLGMANAAATLKGAEYFIDPTPWLEPHAEGTSPCDDDPVPGQGTALPPVDGSWNAVIEAVKLTGVKPGDLSPGIHDLCVRFKDSKGQWGPTRFIHFSTGRALAGCEYFFDVDPGPGKGNAFPAQDATFNTNQEALRAENVPTTGLSIGSHTLTARCRDEWGRWGTSINTTLNILDASGTLLLTVNKTGTGGGNIKSTPEGITCGATCKANFKSGTTVKLTQTATVDSIFKGWSGDCTGMQDCTVTMDKVKTVQAKFDKKIYQLTVKKLGTGTGTVKSTPAGIDCGATCNANFNYGTLVTLTPTPDAGSLFTGWTGACSGNGDCQVNMNAVQSVQAIFDLPPDFVSSISIAGLPLTPKSNFSIRVKITNQGKGSGVIGQLSVWLNNVNTQACNVTPVNGVPLVVAVPDTLAPGETKTITLNGLSAGVAGYKTLRVFADSACATTEPNETNNQSTRGYSVGAPDFVVSSIVTSSPITAQGTFNATITVKNQGTMAGNAGYLDVWAEQPVNQICGVVGDAWMLIGNLNAGASKTVTLSLSSGNAGAKTLRAFIDSWCETGESSESNNQFTAGYKVNREYLPNNRFQRSRFARY